MTTKQKQKVDVKFTETQIIVTNTDGDVIKTQNHNGSDISFVWLALWTELSPKYELGLNHLKD